MLTTSVEGLWVLQALLGIESMPVVMHLKPYIPSIHEDLIVDTTEGRRPLSQTAQYHDLVEAGVIDGQGNVDEVVRDWMTVLGRPDREVVLTIRRPAGTTKKDGTPEVYERVLVICQHRRWLAMAARDGQEIVIGGVGEADDPGQQIDLMCHTLVPAFGEAPTADIDGVNIPMDTLMAAMEGAGPGNADATARALAQAGLPSSAVEVVTAATRHDESAMAVVAVIDHGVQLHVHDQVLTVADTDFGRISFTTTTGADGKQWMSIWPTTNSGLHEDLTKLLSVQKVA